MSFDAVEQIAKAVLYEGYLLYPYRASAVKNRQRWNFGGLYPRAYCEQQRGADAWTMHTECLAIGERPTFTAQVRFLQLVARDVGLLTAPRLARSTVPPLDPSSAAEPEYTVVDSLEIGGRTLHTWQEAVEREIRVEISAAEPHAGGAAASAAGHRLREFALPSACESESVDASDGAAGAIVVRSQQPLDGAVEITVEQLADRLFKICVEVRNETPLDLALRTDRNAALLRSLASTHMILHVAGGEFVSLMDPPEALRSQAGACRNVGAWPVLAGDEGRREFMLCSPIILYDFPQIAPESAGDLFDNTEIDEILTLRILTLTDAEKREMRELDPYARAILERSESLPPEQLSKMHGAIRGLRRVQEPHR